MIQHHGFPSLLYYLLIQSGRHKLREVVVKMNEILVEIDMEPISKDAVYKWARGENTTPPDMIPIFYRAMRERELLDFCVDHTGMMIVPEPEDAESSRSLELEGLDVSAKVGEMSERITVAIADGKITPRERKQIVKTVREAIKELVEVQHKVEGRKGGQHGK